MLHPVPFNVTHTASVSIKRVSGISLRVGGHDINLELRGNLTKVELSGVFYSHSYSLYSAYL